ncbi:MAG: cation-translocating P-type ATPase [Anaerolineae bacterium]|nr:cation-translocating P-type ATPase [Anaerolineae bacterium]
MSTPQTTPVPQDPPDINIAWHALSAEETLQKLNTTPQSGLTSEEAKKRLEIYGYNQLVEKPRPGFFQLLIGQLNNFIVILLIVAAIVSAILGDTVEAIAIISIVILNAILGVVQESRAEEALAALKRMAAPDAQVLRDGRRVSIPARELVPGDIVFLEAGNFIPADVRLLEAVNLRVDEAALTGESVPVQKNASLLLEDDIPIGDRKNAAYMGTTATYGRGVGVVANTGMRTQLGMIADMLQTVEQEETPLQQRLDALGKVLGYAALAICGLVFLQGLWVAYRQMGAVTLTAVKDMFMVAVSLAIAAVPEGLPAVVTISLALGMREMVRRHALIRKLASVETLGSATVICSDKTGTLTQNEMTVTRMWVDGKTIEITGAGYTPRGDFLLDGSKINPKDYPAVLNALWVGTLNNDATLEMVEQNGESLCRMIGDPTEGAILIAAAKAGILASELNQAFPRRDEIPFDSERKRMVTIHAATEGTSINYTYPVYDKQKSDWHAVTVKGAPDIVLNLCTHYQTMDGSVLPLDAAGRERILAANDTLTKDALRVLGLAYRLLPEKPTEIEAQRLEKELVFSGLVGMIDPARMEVHPALEKARGAGIRTIMITGDYPNTARAIANTIGLLTEDHQVMTGAQLNTMSDEQLCQEVMRTDVFARVSPEHKMRIVDALRCNDQIVAMTGDGVNDAPAIKRADIGVAMGITGTDVAKEIADMVLTDDNYASIVSAIEQGRIIYSNIRKFVYYLLSCNLAEIGTIFLGTLISGGSPLTAIQLLWLNLVTDGAPALALATEKGDPDIMIQKPRPPKEPIINRYMWTGIGIQTVAITAVTLAAYFIGIYSDEIHREYAETMAFATLSISELLRAYTARSEYYPLLKIGVFANKWMNWAVLASLALIFIVIYVPFLNPIFNTLPLTWLQWEEILPLIIFPSLAAEMTKLLFSPTRKRAKTS